jgi:protein-S-isoprenylcysteine O-methyltransferase Ste14
MHRSDIIDALILASLWLGYFALHSALASLAVKRWWQTRFPSAMAWYRIGFNVMAVLLLLVPLGYMYMHQTAYLWQWQGITRVFMDALAVVALTVFAWTLILYDMKEFLGLRQAAEHNTTVEDQERLKLSALHRFVRHPWYLLGLVVLWTRSMDLMLLISAIAITVYLKIGSMLEERKLIAYHGETYEKYRRHVPGIIPRPWRFLRKDQAQQLMAGQ